MELLRLLTHGKPGGGGAVTTITTNVRDQDFNDGVPGGSDDDGPFFDIEFAVPLRGDEVLRREKRRFSSNAGKAAEEGFGLTASPDGGSLRRDPVPSILTSDGLFFELVPLGPSSLRDFDASELPKSSKPQAPAFLLKSAARFRVFKLGFHRRSKSTSSELNPGASPATSSASPKQQHQNKFFVKFKVEEVSLASLFTRNNSWRSSSSSRSVRHYADDDLPASDERKLPRDVLRRCLSKIKPLYIRISRRYGEKLRFSGPRSSGAAGKVRPAWEGGEAGGGGDQMKEPASAASSFKGSLKSQDVNLPAGRKVAYRSLRKSRSASAAVASVRSPTLAPERRDDSLLEQQDGIQSAIAHCKRSFNRDSESPLTRSRSDPGEGRSAEAIVSKV
ncbi:hypothetical protein C4D60_Mb04t02460 [Musa balbisiana]|uniref:Membrane-associated kinase regulator 2 n=1 Tax=Musa balbisiana TaxID=52838 RepID=A0A4S8K940_MUSBA|nr:hypothetical protein C4D60_Mb04t02460 [Musa balbisiana]